MLIEVLAGLGLVWWSGLVTGFWFAELGLGARHLLFWWRIMTARGMKLDGFSFLLEPCDLTRSRMIF